MRFGRPFRNTARLVVLTLFVLTPALSGCAKWGEATQGAALPPAPRTPGAVVTEQYICIPHAEAAELLLWIEHAEKNHD